MSLRSSFRRRTTAPRIALVVLLLVGAPLARGAVICVGEDGHAGLKSVFSTCCECESNHDDSHDGVSLEAADHDDCCVDTPIQVQTVAVPRRDADHDLAPSVPVTIAFVCPGVLLAQVPGYEQADPPPLLRDVARSSVLRL